MKIFKIKEFNKWAKSIRLSNKALIDAANEIKQGLVDANLGGHLYKKRVASQSGGKRSGFRTLLAYKRKEKMFFIYGFEKSARSNITEKEDAALKEYAKLLLGYSDSEIEHVIAVGELIEVKDEKA